MPINSHYFFQESFCIWCKERAQLHSSFSFFFFKLINLFLFLAALGLHCYVQAFSSCSKWGLLFIVVRGLLIVLVSLVAEHGL